VSHPRDPDCDALPLIPPSDNAALSGSCTPGTADAPRLN